MPTMSVENMSFKTGMELLVRGLIHSNPHDFSINVGISREFIALHYDLRFDKLGYKRVIALNSMDNNVWQEELRVNDFPFNGDQKFEVRIVFNNHTFDIKVPDHDVLQFPNRLAKTKYSYMLFDGDATVYEITLMKPT